MPGGMFAGRDTELDQLRTALARARGGTGASFLITGEPGIGKSRLIREFASEASAHGARTLSGRALDGPWAMAYAPWIEVLDALDQSSAGIRAVLPAGSYLPIGEAASPGPDQHRIHHFDTVQRILVDESRRQPLLITIDDLQWADTASLELLRHVAWFAPRCGLVLVACERTGEPVGAQPISALLESLRSDSWVTRIPLAGLSPDAVAQMIGRLDHEDQRIVDTLTAQTSGNPFFIEELTGGDTAGQASSGFDESAPGGIPLNLRTAIERRISRLSENARTMLNIASLCSTSAEFAVLRSVTDLTDDALLDALDEVLSAQILVAEPGSSERYAFAHAIVRQTLADGWNPSRRVRAHARIASALESTYQGRTDAVATEIADQYHRARTLPESEAGLPYALVAVDQARRAQSIDQVALFLQIARDLSAHLPADVQAGILGQLAVAEAETVQVDEAVGTLDRYLAVAESAGTDRISIASCLNDLARALKYSAYAPESIWRPVVERALSLTEPGDGLIWARLKLLIDPVEPLSRKGIKSGRWLGFDPEATAILRAAGNEDDVARSVESFDAISRAETDTFLTRVRGFSSPTAVMYGLTVTANHLQYRHGAFRDAHRIWLELIERSERAGALHWEQQATNQLTYLLIASGDFAEAVRFERRSNDLASRLGPGQHPEGHELEMATCRAIYQGTDWQEIAQTWRSLLDDPSLGPHDLSTLTGAFYAALAAYCAAQADDHATAQRLLELLEPIIARMTPKDCNHNGAVAFAVGAAWKLNQGSSAPLYRQLASELIESGAGDYPQTSLHLAHGQALALLGRLPEARTAFATARLTVGEAGQAPMVPVVDFIEAEALWRSNDPSLVPELRALLDRAGSGFARFEMAPWQIDRAVLNDAIEARSSKTTALPGAISEREADVLRLIARGYSDRQISDELFISPRTVNAHVRNMLGKTGVSNRVELAMWARSNGIVTG